MSSMASSSIPLQNSASLSAEIVPQPVATRNFKSDLIDFALKSKIKEPVFCSRDERKGCAMVFRSCVTVDGLKFITPHTFLQRKAAEQEVSRIALKHLISKLKEEVYSLCAKSVTFCKATLNEYAAKLHIKPPTYITVEYKSVIPHFVCTVYFNGISCTGEAARRKGDAENLAARSAILSFIGNSDSGMILIQMIKAKAELFGSVKLKNAEPLHDRKIIIPPKFHGELQVLDKKDNIVVNPVVNNDKIVIQIEILCPRACPNISTIPQPMPTPEPTLQKATKLTNEYQQPTVALPINDVISGKGRRKNNYKTNKRARLAAAADAQ